MSTDPRFQRSQQRLHQAIVDLILEYGYEAISVREIANAARVSYATFYRHYTSKDALLLDVVGRSQAEMAALLAPGDGEAPEQEGRIIFEHIAKNVRFYQILLEGKGARHLLAQAQEAAVEQFVLYFQPAEGVDVPFAIVANHFVAGIIALLRWWLDHDQPYTAERMGQIYADLLYRPIQPFVTRRV